MSVATDNSPARRRLTEIAAGASPGELATALAGAVRPDGTPRPFSQFVARWGDRRAQAALLDVRARLRQGDVRAAMDLCIAELAYDRRNEAMRREVFWLLRQERWRPRLLQALRAIVRERPRSPVPGALLLYGLIQAGHLPRKELTSGLVWGISLPWLLDHTMPERVAPVARHLADAFPKITFLDEVARGLAQVPEAAPGARFRDHWNGDVQLVRAAGDGPAPLLVCFTGLFGRMGTSINTFHRWPAHEHVHVLYLKDLRRRFYRDGVMTLSGEGGGGVERMHLFIAAVAEALGATGIATYGVSMGGIPAIEAALAVGAGRVVWAAGAVEREDRRQAWDAESERQRRETTARDLLARLREAPRAPEIACIFGADYAIDREMPEVLAAHPAVRLHPLHGLSNHNVDFHLVKAGRFDRLIRWAAFGPEPLELT